MSMKVGVCIIDLRGRQISWRLFLIAIIIHTADHERHRGGVAVLNVFTNFVKDVTAIVIPNRTAVHLNPKP